MRHLANTLSPLEPPATGTPGPPPHSQYSSRRDSTSAWLHRGASPETKYSGPGHPLSYPDGDITFWSDWMLHGDLGFTFLPATEITAPPNDGPVPYTQVFASACETNIYRNFVFQRPPQNQPFRVTVNHIHLVPEDCVEGSPPVAAWVDYDQLYDKRHVLDYFDPRYGFYEVRRGHKQANGTIANETRAHPPADDPASSGGSTTLAVEGGYHYRVCAATTSAGPCVASIWLWVGDPQPNVRAWGNNADGQVGDGTNTGRLTPVAALAPGAVAVAAGLSHTLALTAGGEVWAWGQNQLGQLGDGTTTGRNTPVQVVGLDGAGTLGNVAAIAAGWSSSLALLNDGTVVTWGPNDFGQLGNGTTGAPRLYPGTVPGLSGVTAVAGAEAAHFALKSDGAIWAWGYNNCGKLGIGNDVHQPAPVQVSQASGLTNATKLVSNARHSFALQDDGTLWSWGCNPDGRVGDGSTTDRWTPVQVSLSGVVDMASGIVNSVAVLGDGSVWTWGANDNGELASGATSGPRLIPGAVAGLSGVTAVSAGGALERGYALVRQSDGTVWAWGDNTWGQLGDASQTDRVTPVQTDGLTTATAVAAGGDHSAALITP